MPLAETDFSDAIAFSRASAAAYLNESGVLATVPDDVAAFQRSAGGTRLGLILEGAATQSIANTSDPDTLMAATRGTITADQTTAPDGTTTAAKFAENTDNDTHYIGRNAGVSGNSGTLTNFSVFLKANGRTKFQVTLFDFSALSNFIRTTVDLTAGTATGTTGGAGEILLAPAPEAYPNGWYRVTVIGVPNVGGSGVTYPRVAALSSAGAGNYAGDGNSGFFYWGFNATTAKEPRSFIPTTAAPATRAADLASLINLDATFGALTGTFRLRFRIPTAAPSDASRTLLHLDDGTTDNSYDIRVNAGGVTVAVVVRSGGSEVANLTAGAASITGQNLLAFSYTADGFRASLNGAPAVSDVSGAVPSGITRAFFGASDDAGANSLNGILGRVRRYRAATSAVDLASMSAAWPD
jgi:hypothetical protein